LRFEQDLSETRGKIAGAVVRLGAALIEVEVDIGQGPSSITIVGLRDPTRKLRTIGGAGKL
jgi:hypothetical protein